MKKEIIFDMDGTLWDSADILFENAHGEESKALLELACMISRRQRILS